MLAKSKLTSTEILKSQAWIDLEISYEGYKTTVDEKKVWRNERRHYNDEKYWWINKAKKVKQRNYDWK